MNILIFCAIIWAICKLLSAASRKAKEAEAERERERMRAEQQRIREEQSAQREYQRYLAAAQREQAKRQAEHEKAIAKAKKEQEVLRKEQERQAKAQAKLEEEQRKQAQAIRDLRYKMLVYESEHKAIKQRLDNLYELHEIASNKVAEADRAGDDNAKATALRKIISIENQIAAAEKKERDYRYRWTEAKKKVSA